MRSASGWFAGSSSPRRGWSGFARDWEGGDDVALPCWRDRVRGAAGVSHGGAALAGAVLMKLTHLSNGRGTSAASQSSPGCEQRLARARDAIRRGELDVAEAFVTEGGNDDELRTCAACLNVLGLIAEARGQWPAAKRFWGRSVRADRRYGPPRQNLRRYFELFQFG